jgi:2-oxoisovalerate dehydrogenase E2 component (dihydrolipoyl transacylase)
LLFKIELPHVGESVTEAVIGKWLKKPGDSVRKFEAIVEVVTDKVSMEVPAPAAGTLSRITAAEGETVPMGAVIAEMEVDPAAVPPRAAASAAQAGAHVPPAERIGTMVMGANVGPTGGVFQDTSLGGKPAVSPAQPPAEQQAAASGIYSPVVLKLAAEHRLDLATVTGTGEGGRVTRKDVLAAVAARGHAAAPQGAPADRDGDTLVTPTPIRALTAATMSRSFREIPHAWSAIEVDATGMAECRAARRDGFKAAHGHDLTFLAFTLHAVSRALRAVPVMNSSWEDGKVRLRSRVNVCIAVATDQGLVVPVVHDADRLSVTALALRLAPLVDRARSGKLTVDDVRGGTFTLNNTGALGSVWGGAIINPPQAAILTTEAIVRRPVVLDGQAGETIAIRSVMNICLSFDHRVADGADAAAFMQAVRKRIESITRETSLD